MVTERLMVTTECVDDWGCGKSGSMEILAPPGTCCSTDGDRADLARRDVSCCPHCGGPVLTSVGPRLTLDEADDLERRGVEIRS